MHDHSSHEHVHYSLNQTAFRATLHCLLGCSIGEILGMVIGTALGWGNVATIALAVALAFLIGYSFTLAPLLRAGLMLKVAILVAFAADTFSIATMEIVDNLVMVFIPGAMNAHFTDVLFWTSLALSLALAAVAAFPVNRFLIARGRGHAIVHHYHHHNEQSA